MKAAVDWNKAKLDSSVKFCQYRKMTKEKNQKKKKKKSKIENLTLMGATQQAHDSLCTHTQVTNMKMKPEPEGVFWPKQV